jgi:hypothetical protein
MEHALLQIDADMPTTLWEQSWGTFTHNEMNMKCYGKLWKTCHSDPGRHGVHAATPAEIPLSQH